MTASFLLVGCGKMGGAMLQGWLNQGTRPGAITIVDSNLDATEDLSARLGVNAVVHIDQLDHDYSPDVVILAVKPQVMDQVLPAYAKLVARGSVFLSIAAGRTISSFEAILGPGAAIVRAMPNTPAAVGRGMTVGCPNAHVTPTQANLCKTLLGAVGDVEWIEDEGLLDAVTALSGSGPAYIFLLVEAMSHAGCKAGLPADLAARLARATVTGSAELLHQSLLSALNLRENVTSPGGTTAAALAILRAEGGLTDLMTKAILAATKRSKELAS